MARFVLSDAPQSLRGRFRGSVVLCVMPIDDDFCKREGEAASAGRRLAAVAVLVGCTAGCAAGITPQPTYDVATRQLMRLDVDTDKNGIVDQRTYLRGGTPLRSEMDADEDGRIDRWEYVTPSGDLISVGTSSRGDGVEDRWTFVAEEAGLRRVDIATGRTRHVDRREFFRETELVRAEEDSNEDGRPDKWEHYVDGRLRQVAFDTSRAAGRPDRRFSYDARGVLSLVEHDDDRDGNFEVMTPDQAPAGVGQ